MSFFYFFMYDESTLLYVQTHSNLNEIQTLTDKTLGFTALHTHLSDIPDYGSEPRGIGQCRMKLR